MNKVFVVDPGTHTGVAWGCPGSGISVKSRLAGIDIESRTIEGDPVSQALDLEELCFEFCAGSHVDIVIEDFILRKMTMDRELLDPVRVASGFIALIADSYSNYNLTWQQPSAAMTYATNDRLRGWGLWLKGSDPMLEHQRDARRHFALYVAEQIRARSANAS